MKYEENCVLLFLLLFVNKRLWKIVIDFSSIEIKNIFSLFLVYFFFPTRDCCCCCHCRLCATFFFCLFIVCWRFMLMHAIAILLKHVKQTRFNIKYSTKRPRRRKKKMLVKHNNNYTNAQSNGDLVAVIMHKLNTITFRGYPIINQSGPLPNNHSYYAFIFLAD